MTPVRVVLAWCPDWSLAAARESHGIAADVELALVDKGVVTDCSAAAQREGVVPGIRLRQAQHRCPDMVVLPRDADLDRRTFEPVVRAIEQVVPGVHVIRPGAAAVRAQGASRFYGGDRAAAQTLLAQLRSHVTHDVRLAVADGLFAAERAARTTTPESPIALIPAGGSPEFLAPLPVAAIESEVSDRRLGNLLRRLGIRTLGELAALPGPDVHARFGESGLRAHQLARGGDLPVLSPREIPVDLSTQVLFDPATDHAEQVVAACEPAVDRLLERLERDAAVCTAVRVEVCTTGARHEHVWRHPWHFTATDVLDRVRWQLRDLGAATSDRLRADEGGAELAVTGVGLTLESVVPAQHQAEGLWGARPDEHVVHAITTLQHRLGHDGVLGGALGGGRLLRERQLLRPWGEPAPTAAQRRADQPWPGTVPGPAPASVFGTARAVRVLGPDRADVTVTERGDLSAEPVWFLPHADRVDPHPHADRVDPHPHADRVGPSLRGPYRDQTGLDTGSASASPYPSIRPPQAPGYSGRRSTSVGGALRVLAWGGPWPVRQRWWRRGPAYDRLQVVDEHQQAWLLLHESGRWWAEARYD